MTEKEEKESKKNTDKAEDKKADKDEGKDKKTKEEDDKSESGDAVDANKLDDEGVDIGEGSGAIQKTTDRSTLSDKAEDFQVRVKILEARQLAGAGIRPVVRVKIGKSQIKVTRTKKGSSPLWNEMLMFNFKDSLKNLYDFTVEFTVKNSRKLRSDAMIGQFKLDLGNVYDQPGHAYVRKWIFLTDPEDSSNTPQGYLKATMCVLGAGDEPPSEETKEDDDDDVEGNMLTPAGASLRSAIFYLRVLKAEDVPQMDSNTFQSMKKFIGMKADAKALVDPYLEFRFAGKKRKTHAIEKDDNPEWNEELTLPMKFPSMCDTLQFSLFDDETLGPSEAIGTLKIPISKISSTGEDSESGFLPTFGPTFVNVYGAPREPSSYSGDLHRMNKGKSKGCSYRGRMMIELKTKPEEEDMEMPEKRQPIEEELLLSYKKYMKRRKYRLLVVFHEAGMIKKTDEPIEFEVSMGNYGNKFDENNPLSGNSTTEPTQPVYDGTNYYYVPWESQKQIVCLSPHWEDVGFRYHSMNVILRMVAAMEYDIKRVKKMIADEKGEMEVASEIVEILDELIVACNKGVPDPRGRNLANPLDFRQYALRTQQLLLMATQAEELRQTCTDANEAIASLQEYLERLEELAYEPQNSMPDVIIWMISDKKRIAYARIPAYEVLYCKEKKQYSGRMCGRMQNIILRYPTASHTSKKNHAIACQLQATVWLGKAVDQDAFDFNSRGKMSVYADTYETEIKVPIKGWSSDGYKDLTNEIPLPKNKFVNPPDWEWEGDWFVSPSSSRMLEGVSGKEAFTAEAYEIQSRQPGGHWKELEFQNSASETITGLDAIVCEEGWVWQHDWEKDSSTAVDEDGWEYTTSMEKDNPVWQPFEKVFHLIRRRRWVRTKKCVDAKIQAKKERAIMTLEEGWEYAITSSNQFHSDYRTLDMFRRRRWMRSLKPTTEKGSSIMFDLEHSLVGSEDLPPIEDSESEENEDEEKVSLKEVEETAPEADESDKVPTTSTTKIGGFFSRKSKKDKDEDGAESSKKKKKKKKKVRKMPTPKIYLKFEGPVILQLRVYMYQARDLLPTDEGNFADPYVYVVFMSQCKKTEVINHTLNPIWDQTIIIDMEYYGDLNHLRSNCPDVVLEFYDRDSMGQMDYMGRSSVQPMIKLNSEDPTNPRLVWHDIRRGKLDGGSALVTAELLVKSEDKDMPFLPPTRNNVYQVPPGIRPELQRMAIEFKTWGVRNMKSFKLLSVDKPSVLLQIGDVELRTPIIKNLKKNSNFEDPIFFIEANLPKELIYCPPVVIRVKDNRKFGSRPTVGQHILSNIGLHVIEAPPVQIKEITDDDEGFGDTQDTVIEITPPIPGEKLDSTSESYENIDIAMSEGEGTSGLSQAPDEAFNDERQLVSPTSEHQSVPVGTSTPAPAATSPGSDPTSQNAEIDVEQGKSSPQLVIEDGEEATQEDDTHIEIYDPDESGSDVQDSDSEDEEEGIGQNLMKGFEGFGKMIKDVVPFVGNEPEEYREDEIDWWSKYYASTGDSAKCGHYLGSGLDIIKIYKGPLENQKPFKKFYDFIQTFELTRGQPEHDDDALPVVGEFKGAIFMYPLPADPNDPLPERIFRNIPSTDPVAVKVRVYCIKATDLAPQDPNGLADPYLKIKVGKKRILDRKNYIPNTLDPVFGRMFELDLLLPQEKDLHVEIFDWDLIGTDDKVGETVIDLENRYFSKYKAWCGLPLTYCSQGPNKWRDQMTPKQWLLQKAKEMEVDEPVWNGNTSLLFNNKKYLLDRFEKNMTPSKDWGEADERLALHVLRTMPHVTEHVETRPLYNDDMPGIEQGRLQLWIDMFPKDFGDPEEPFDITPRTPSDYYLRVIIWNCREIPMMDTNIFGEKMTDIYIKGWLGGMESKKQKTDIHYRSLDGTGMFNWRFVFPFQYIPQEQVLVVSKKEHFWNLDKTTTKVPPVLTIQAWDNDLFQPNEYISEIALPLTKAPKCSKFQRFATLKSVPDLHGNCDVPLLNLFDQKMLQGWWPLYTVKDGERVQAGKVEMTVEVITSEEQEERPSGKARKDPNENPKLEKPKRPATSFAWFSSPWKSFRYIIWKRYRCIILTILLVLLLVAFIALFIYTFPGSFTGWFLGKF